MNRTLKVLLVIAIVVSAVQVAALVVDILTPPRENMSALAGFAAEAVVRWKVYLVAAVAGLVIGFVLRKRRPLAGNSMVIAGVYLLILANNGGLFAQGHEVPRLVTSILTLLLLVLVAVQDVPTRSGADTLLPGRADA
jgi:hypothetical protein